MAASRNRNENASASLLGWIGGLAYFQWWSANPAHLSIGLLVIIGLVGFFVTDIAISNSVCTLAALVSYRMTGAMEGAKAPFILAALVSMALSFLTAELTLHLLR